MTVNEKILFPLEKESKTLVLKVSTDASFAPGGTGSRTGVVILLNDLIIHWASSRQSCVATSTCEAEIQAHVTGFKLMMGIGMVAETYKHPEIVMEGDNLAAIQSLTNNITSWKIDTMQIEPPG